MRTDDRELGLRGQVLRLDLSHVLRRHEGGDDERWTRVYVYVWINHAQVLRYTYSLKSPPLILYTCKLR